MAVYIDNQGGAWAIADPSADSVQAADPLVVTNSHLSTLGYPANWRPYAMAYRS